MRRTPNKKVTGLRSIDGKLYYFDANGVKQDNVTFGIDVSKYQSGLDWNKIKKSGVSFVIIRIGYRGYGAAGNLVKDPMFEEHFTNARNAGLKVGVYFFTQAVNEAEAQEEADGCNWALNGRMLDTPSSMTPRPPPPRTAPAAPTVWVLRTAPSAPSPSASG